MKPVAFFNTSAGVGKTTLVYHLAWMFAEHGETVLAVDLDPQANLTSMMLPEDRLEVLWSAGEHPRTIFGAVRPMIRGQGEVMTPHIETVDARLGLVVGDPSLSTLEETLSDAWLHFQSDAPAFHMVTMFSRVVRQAAEAFGATWVLIDTGSNLGAINRAALIASESVVIPLGPDLFSLKGLGILGPALRSWRTEWVEAVFRQTNPVYLPPASMEPLGYVVMQHASWKNRPPMAYQRWVEHFPLAYRDSVLDARAGSLTPSADRDPYCLAMMKHYRSLLPMAIDARKPVFLLKPADGAIGAHLDAVRGANLDFLELARRIAQRCGASLG
ncbi:MAG TPA: ParA family protein [Thermoanaerobaculia bacterium]|nr:ParA family protein [Thermoanaerobaculia bacterium]